MRIAYRTDNVPQWGTGAFAPAGIPTPLASTGGTQVRYLEQWTDAQDPNVAGFANTAPWDLSYQPSYAQVGLAPNVSRQPQFTGQDPPGAVFGDIPDRAYVPGLPLAFRPVVNARHHMAYVASPENMGPVAWQRIKIFSDNVLPVPAANPGRTGVPAQTQPPFGTVVATPWPRPFITWPTWGTSRQA